MRRKEFLSWSRTLGIAFLILAVFLVLSMVDTVKYVVKESERRSIIRFHRPSQIILDCKGQYLDDVASDDQEFGYWAMEGKPVPQRLLKTFLAAEDKDFFENQGPDWKAMARAVLQNAKAGKRVSGASTLTMQIVRLEYPAERNYLNKIIETWASTKMVKRYGHDRLLRHYLTIAPFGNRYHGVRFSAERYFSKPVEDLSLAEAALLAAIPKSPVKYNPARPDGLEYAKERAAFIISKMRKDGFIQPAEESRGLALLKTVRIAGKPKRPDYALHAILRIRDELKEKSIPDLVIRTGLDLGMQRIFAERAASYVIKRRNKGVGNVALIVASRSTGEILSYVGSAVYGEDLYGGSMDYARTPRSSGSTLKPFVFALGMMEKGFTGATILPDLPVTFASGSAFYQPQNSDTEFNGPVLYRFALANSRNLPSLYLVKEIGLFKTFGFLRELGLVKSGVSPEHYGLGIAIGHLSVTLGDLVDAYGVLANGGLAFRSGFVTEGDVGNPKKERLIPEDIAQLITIYLADPNARMPVFPRMGNLEYPFPVAVKTGTSQGFRDAWTVAYTSDYVVGIWTGTPDNSKMDNLSGLNSSASLMKDVMAVLHRDKMDGLSDTTLKPPEGYVMRSVSKLTGKICDPESPDATTEYFKPGTEPVEEQQVAALSPESDAGSGVAIVMDPLYGDWASGEGLKIIPSNNDLLGNPLPMDLSDFTVRITEPADGSRYYLSDLLPSDTQVIQLKAVVLPGSGNAVWYVDGKPFATADYPFTVSWPLQKGTHLFQLKLPSAPFVSQEVRVEVE